MPEVWRGGFYTMKNLLILIAIIIFIFTKYVHTKTRVQADIRVTFKTSKIAGRSGPSGIPNRKIPSKITNTESVGIYKAQVLDWQKPIAEKIRATFKEEPDTAIAIFRAESGLRPEAQGWNCYYNGESKPCAEGDRDKAWSTDCGIAQLNFPGSVCPAESFNEDWNIAKAYEWKYLPNKKAGGTGFRAWSVYNSGRYLAFLTNL